MRQQRLEQRRRLGTMIGPGRFDQGDGPSKRPPVAGKNRFGERPRTALPLLRGGSGFAHSPASVAPGRYHMYRVP